MSNAYPWCYVDFNRLTMEDTLYVPHKKMMGGVPQPGEQMIFFDREGNSSMAEVIMSGDDSLIARADMSTWQEGAF